MRLLRISLLLLVLATIILHGLQVLYVSNAAASANAPLRDETPLSKLASGFGRRRVLVRPRGGMPADNVAWS